MCELINLPGGGTAFICGGHHGKTHECNEDGGILLLDDGQRVPDTEENQKVFAEKIRGGSVACTICGHAAIDDAFRLDV